MGISKKILFLLLFVCAQIFTLVILLGGVEMFYRYFLIGQKSVYYGEAQLSNKLLEVSKEEASSANLKWQIPVQQLPPRYAPTPRKFSPAKIDRDMGSGYAFFDSEVGPTPTPGFRKHSKATRENGEIVYDVTYNIDNFGRRTTVGSDFTKKDQALIFLGCSFTFGEGIEDENTIPSQVARKQKHFKVYNYSFHGWGPGNLLRRISRPNFKDEIHEPRGRAIYLFIDSHMDRVLGSLLLLGPNPSWRDLLPNYYLDSQGNLQSDGFIGPQRPIESWLYSILIRSAIFQYHQINLPPRYTTDHFKLFVAITKQMKDRLAQIGIADFYVAIWPESKLAKPLVHFLNEANISTIDYSNFDLNLYARPIEIPGDGHPTAETADFLSDQLIRDLKL